MEALFQLSLVILTMLTGGFILVWLGSYITAHFWGFSLFRQTPVADLNPEQMLGFRVIQVFYALGAFLLPPLVFVKALRLNATQFLGLNRHSNWMKFLFVGLIWALFYPFVSWMHELNSSINLESFGTAGELALEKVNEADTLTEMMMTMPSFSMLLLNLFIVGLVPAITEEFFFRGLLQRLFQTWMRNGHIAVWISAILFSSIHMQFDGFIPRVLLGALFGYFLLWTGNLKLSIFAHFLNNSAMVVLSYLFQHGYINIDPEAEFGWMLGSLSLLISIPLLIAFYRMSRTEALKVLANKEGEVNWVKIYDSHDLIASTILKDKLVDEGYQAIIINKKDTAYGTFGSVEVYVPSYEVESALARLKEWNL